MNFDLQSNTNHDYPTDETEVLIALQRSTIVRSIAAYHDFLRQYLLEINILIQVVLEIEKIATAILQHKITAATLD